MKKLIFPLLILILPVFSHAADTTLTNDSISWKSEISLESNSLNMDFANRMLFGGYINESQKNSWISKLDDNNTIFSEVSNTLSFHRNFGDNSFFFSIADRNLAKMSFTKDLMKVALFGNYNYQGDTLHFDKTNFTLDRFQQIKLGYGKIFKIQENNLTISTAVSYLNGNHHLSFTAENASFYTAPFGTHNSLDYDMNAFATDTANFNYFQNNGNGFAFDFAINFESKNKKYTLYLDDLGYINWKESALKYNTDTSFSFNGFEIENLLDFNDSILEAESDKYLEDIYIKARKGTVKSYIPANFGFKMETPLNDLYFSKYIVGFNLKWQPNQDNKLLSFEKVLQGFYESGYSPYFYLKTFTQTKNALLIPQISIGGYSQKLSFGITTQFGNKIPIRIGTQHLESIFKGKESNSLSVYLQTGMKF
ncbi:MAG TPA: hypothetical protein EYG01_03100 [Flavobacteriales bacterium]|nr:hypothetical protein [Flavobacteriales bacterium]